MMGRLFGLVMVVLLLPAVAGGKAALAQAGFGDDRVMLQGFYWESFRHGHPDSFPQFGDKPWYRIVHEQAPAIREGRFDLVWLPPPSLAAVPPALSAGYNPKEYFTLDNSYGSSAEHRDMLTALLSQGIEPVADIVINHRDGYAKWADFRNPSWGAWAITRDDSAFTNANSELVGTSVADRGAPEEPVHYDTDVQTSFDYDGYRDLDHTDIRVRRDIVRYMLQLKSAGYRGWRYDMVHGYHARWIALYNRATHPTFSVGEYDWSRHGAQRGWMWHSATEANRLETASSVFDFAPFWTLKDNIGRYDAWYGGGRGLGKLGDTTDGHPWRNRAVTFIQNHDTGRRTLEDGTPEQHHDKDDFTDTWQIEQAYAYILTHPGVPTVFWKHYFDRGETLRERIRAMINARKVAGVHAGSELHTQDNARANGVYAARVDGRHGTLYVRVGGDDAKWQPQHSGYADYREYAAGDGWKVWVGLPGNPETRQAPLAAPLPVPSYQDPADIAVADEQLK